jgi:hypothetical protein
LNLLATTKNYANPQLKRQVTNCLIILFIRDSAKNFRPLVEIINFIPDEFKTIVREMLTTRNQNQHLMKLSVDPHTFVKLEFSCLSKDPFLPYSGTYWFIKFFGPKNHLERRIKHLIENSGIDFLIGRMGRCQTEPFFYVEILIKFYDQIKTTSVWKLVKKCRDFEVHISMLSHIKTQYDVQLMSEYIVLEESVEIYFKKGNYVTAMNRNQLYYHALNLIRTKGLECVQQMWEALERPHPTFIEAKNQFLIEENHKFKEQNKGILENDQQIKKIRSYLISQGYNLNNFVSEKNTMITICQHEEKRNETEASENMKLNNDC